MPDPLEPQRAFARTRRVFLPMMILLFLAVQAGAADGGPVTTTPAIVQRLSVDAFDTAPSDPLVPRENQRLVAASLALFLGPFGAHRLYFGTTAKVPIIYGITFGGFGILAVIDLGHILFTKDLSRYRDCDRVFMWARPKPATTPP